MREPTTSPPDALPPLNCGGCTTCCRGDIIHLKPGDDPAAYKTKMIQGRRALARRSNGDCVYLGRRGCTIHGRAPQACRNFDCRKYALLVEQMTEDERASRLAHPQTRGSIEEGWRRLGMHSTSEWTSHAPAD